MKQTLMAKIKFKTKPYKIGSTIIVHLPKTASAKLSSRGLGMADGMINNVAFQAPLEPDGKGSHWFELTTSLSKSTGDIVGKDITIVIEPAKKWSEPRIPSDVKKALAAHPDALEVWDDTTTLARWDWLRWIRSTNNRSTRQIRIEKMISKLQSGNRRPCCFNTSMCTVPKVSKSGVLLEPPK